MNVESTALRSALDAFRAVEPRIADAIAQELTDQRESLKLIASENYASPAVLLAMGEAVSLSKGLGLEPRVRRSSGR